MAENINFIPATELPEALGDDVSVICLENGELKQRPVASIGGGPLLCRTYTSEDVVLSGNGATGEKYIVDEEIVRAVFQSINNKTKMPIICCILRSPDEVYFPTSWSPFTNGQAFSFDITGHGTWYIFDTYDHAYAYYNR